MSNRPDGSHSTIDKLADHSNFKVSDKSSSIAQEKSTSQQPPEEVLDIGAFKSKFTIPKKKSKTKGT